MTEDSEIDRCDDRLRETRNQTLAADESERRAGPGAVTVSCVQIQNMNTEENIFSDRKVEGLRRVIFAAPYEDTKGNMHKGVMAGNLYTMAPNGSALRAQPKPYRNRAEQKAQKRERRLERLRVAMEATAEKDREAFDKERMAGICAQ